MPEDVGDAKMEFADFLKTMLDADDDWTLTIRFRKGKGIAMRIEDDSSSEGFSATGWGNTFEEAGNRIGLEMAMIAAEDIPDWVEDALSN